MQEVWPLQPVATVGPVRGVESDGLAAMYDTLAAALLQPVEPARRHVVIARTKGIDTISAIDAIALRAIAERADALFHLVLMETALDNDDETSAFQCFPMAPDRPNSAMGLCWPTNRSWVPRQGRLIGGGPFHIVTAEGGLVKAGVETTGGDWHQTTGISEPTLTGTFRATFENFRTNYVLRYSPRGVTRGGWHAISVTVPQHRDYRISARKGYGIDEMPPPSPAPAPVTTPRTLAELTTAYEHGAYQAVVSSLRQMPDTTRLLKEFEAAGNPWPAAPRREAAFVLELAEPSVFSPRVAEREYAHRLLLRFADLTLDPLEPSMFERYWHFAALAQLQGELQPATAAVFVERALARFPTEPQFLLARAIVEDQRSYVGRTRGQPARGAADEARVRQFYEAAIAVPEVAVEAHLRLAWYLHRTGQSGDAAVMLRDASAMTTTDPVLRVLARAVYGPRPPISGLDGTRRHGIPRRPGDSADRAIGSGGPDERADAARRPVGSGDNRGAGPGRATCEHHRPVVDVPGRANIDSIRRSWRGSGNWRDRRQLKRPRR